MRDAPLPPPDETPRSEPEVLRGALPDLGRGTHDAPRLVVDVWLAVPATEGWQVLLLRRSEARGGFWQGVSGRVERRDASLEAAARREIEEETGLAEGVAVFDLGRWIEFDGFVSGRRFRKRSLGATLPVGTAPEDVTLSEEHVEARLVPFDEAMRLVRWRVNADELDRLARLLAARVG